MRKILFRGFSPDNEGKIVIKLNGETVVGKWLYGYPTLGDSACTTKELEGCPCLHNGSEAWMTFWLDECHEYDEDICLGLTIGQWVTIDKNGKDVFDGDIVRIEGINGRCIIEYHEGTVCWYIHVLSVNKYLYLFNHMDEIEVIGNIYEEALE